MTTERFGHLNYTLQGHVLQETNLAQRVSQNYVMEWYGMFRAGINCSVGSPNAKHSRFQRQAIRIVDCNI